MQTYPTKEQCLAVNGEHAWVYDSEFGEMDAQYCTNCPARRVYRQVQEPKFEWVEE